MTLALTIWDVEVEIPGWPPSSSLRDELRLQLEDDDRVVRVLDMPLEAPPPGAPLFPKLTVEVCCIGEGEAFRFAKRSGGGRARRARSGEHRQPLDHPLYDQAGIRGPIS